MMFRKHILFATTAAMLLSVLPSSAAPPDRKRPNILWITAEDMSAQLGCYGDHRAHTPNLDQFAQRAVRYSHAFATAPVCSPARSCLITGVYATSLGTQRLRSVFPLPSSIKGFPSYLRGAGYFTTNNVKTDYNVLNEQDLIDASWDRNGADAHWRQRAEGQPFFSVFNLMTTHQSRSNVWPDQQFEREVGSQLSPAERHDPERMLVPPYYPDTPLVRKTLARYYDCVAVMDKQVGRLLTELQEDGLDGDTIVFFFSDHGMGLPRGKRLLHDTGMHVPLLVYCPETFRDFIPAQPGTTTRRLVSFVDLPPTVLELAGLSVPDYMQGLAFLGPNPDAEREYVFGARDRVDEAFDLSRSVRDGRYLFIRNYMPHLSWMQPEWYSDQSQMRQELVRLYQAGQLNAAQLTYAAARRPREELYDTQNDPGQLKNLAASTDLQEVLQRLRNAQRKWVIQTGDVGFLTESDAWRRCAGDAPWDLSHDRERYPIDRILSIAEWVGDRDRVPDQIKALTSDDEGIRYWAAVGLGAALDSSSRPALRQALSDDSVPVKVEAATALVAMDDAPEAIAVLVEALDSEHVEDVLHAVRGLELLGDRAAPALEPLRDTLNDAQRQVKLEGHPCWLFVLFSADSALRQLEPNSSRPRPRF